MSIATEDTEAGSLLAEQGRIRGRLARTRRALRLQMALETALDAAALAAGLGLVLVAIDWGFRPGLATRQALLGIAAVGALVVLAVRSGPRLRACRLGDLALAMTLDRYRPGTGQQVADVLQLPGLLDEPGGSASPEFVRLAVRRATAGLAGVDWRAHWNRGRTAGRGLGLAVALGVPVAFGLAAPATARLSDGPVAPGRGRAVAAADLPVRGRPGRRPPAPGTQGRAVRRRGPGRPGRGGPGPEGLGPAGSGRADPDPPPARPAGGPRRGPAPRAWARRGGPDLGPRRDRPGAVPPRAAPVGRRLDLRPRRRRRLARPDPGRAGRPPRRSPRSRSGSATPGPPRVPGGPSPTPASTWSSCPTPRSS